MTTLTKLRELTVEEFKQPLYISITDAAPVELTERTPIVWGQNSAIMLVHRPGQTVYVEVWDRSVGGESVLHGDILEGLYGWAYPGNRIKLIRIEWP